MLTEGDIAYYCSQRTFQRAQQIAANSKNILTKKCQFNGDETHLSAFVASSSGWNDRYKTSACINEVTGEILDYACTCPAYINYDGMCKHSVALTLSYMTEPRSFIGYKESRAPETSPSIIAYMQKAERFSKCNTTQGSIRLEPTFVYGYGEFSVRFKIAGSQGKYVLKDIGGFLKDLDSGEYVSYGQKLAFTHSLNAFDQDSKRIIRLIRRSCLRQTGKYDSLPWHSYRSTGPLRSLNLNDSELIELLDIIKSQTFTIECTDLSMPRHMDVHVVEGDPFLPIRILKSDEYGYLISRDHEAAFVADAGQMYVLQDSMFFHCSEKFAQCADFLKSVYRSNDDQLFISAKDMPLFCATVLPMLEESLTVDAPEELELMKPIPGNLQFYFDKNNNEIIVDACVVYGSHLYHLFEPKDASDAFAPLRDDVLERRGKSIVSEYFLNQPRIPLSNSEMVGELLYGGIARFRETGDVFTTPAFDRLIISKKPRTQIGLSLAANLIDLDISIEDVQPEEVSALLASYRKRKKFHRLRNGVFANLADYNLRELDRMLEDFSISPDDILNGHLELPSYRAFFIDREFADAMRDASFIDYIDRFHAIDPTAYQVPPTLEKTLRPYQQEGFAWLNSLVDLGFGGILADEMGLGKSVQMISLLLSRSDEALRTGPSLIVCPASLVYNWLSEFHTFAPQLNVRAIEGTRSMRNRIRREERVDVFIASYDVMRMDVDDFQQRSYYCHILDEAQYIKNHATLTTRAAKRINSLHRFALTGTPIENRLSEVWSIFDFLMPGFLGSYMRFRERYEIDILGGNEEIARRLQWLISPFILRRLKETVLPDLPEKIDSVLYVPLTEKQRELYAAHEQNLRDRLLMQKQNKNTPSKELSKVEVLAELTKLRQISLDPSILYENFDDECAKMPAILDLIEQARDGGEKTLVFSQFTSYIKLMQSKLDQHGIPYYTITGATPKKDRVALVNAFNADRTPVFLVSLKAGGTGLNLTGASVVVHTDPWWNAAATNQATDRAHRIGQERPVSVYKVIAKNTIEERILKLQNAKKALSDSIISENGLTNLSNLTKEDLLRLLEE